ncbi:unnamed protein product, partial [Discosporangium mesarthrocarpum]
MSLVAGRTFADVVPMPSAALPDDLLITRIAFGSCAKTDKPQAVFDEILRQDPNVFLMIGDNVYAEDESADPALQSLSQAYRRLADSAPFQRLREAVPLMVTWDDHDYGLNDAGGDWPGRFASERLFLDAWAVAPGDVRRKRDGVYFSKTVGVPGRQVQFIVLDTRFFR